MNRQWNARESGKGGGKYLGVEIAFKPRSTNMTKWKTIAGSQISQLSVMCAKQMFNSGWRVYDAEKGNGSACIRTGAVFKLRSGHTDILDSRIDEQPRCCKYVQYPGGVQQDVDFPVVGP